MELLGHLEDASIDPRVSAWLTRATTWRGNLEVQGPPAPGEAPVFLLLGERERLPLPLRERAVERARRGNRSADARLLAADRRRFDAWISPAARRCIAALEDGRPGAASGARALERPRGPNVRARARARSACCVNRFAALPGAVHAEAHGAAPRVSTPSSRGSERIRSACRSWTAFLADGGIWIEPEALELLQEVREEHARAAGLVALSSATEGHLHVTGLGGELKPFQRAGVSYLLERRRAFLADEQGLGKTIEALAAIEAAGAYPAVVVCPASLKLNWLRELARWLPQRTARALSGHGGARSGDVDEPEVADVTVVNYDIVAARLQELCAIGPQALVLDESHYCKNAAAKRTQAVQRLSSVGAQRWLGPGFERDASDQPSSRADLAAAYPRASCRLRLGCALR